MKAHFRTAFPYAGDKLQLPVASVETALPFYQTVMGFTVLSQDDSPHRSAVLERDSVRIGLAENGGDPEQNGCFLEVDDVEAALAELKERGLPATTQCKSQQHGDKSFKVFFVIAPDGLCYCVGQPEVGEDGE